jgi:hypothetical protein
MGVKNASSSFSAGGGRSTTFAMADLWVVLAVLAFFALCVALVWGCDRIIGPDELEDLDEQPDDVSDPAVLA